MKWCHVECELAAAAIAAFVRDSATQLEPVDPEMAQALRAGARDIATAAEEPAS